MTFKERRDALRFHRDVFEIAKFLMWDSDIGRDKAQEIINKIHNKKYGDTAGVWVQYERILNKLENELIKEIYE